MFLETPPLTGTSKTELRQLSALGYWTHMTFVPSRLKTGVAYRYPIPITATSIVFSPDGGTAHAMSAQNNVSGVVVVDKSRFGTGKTRGVYATAR